MTRADRLLLAVLMLLAALSIPVAAFAARSGDAVVLTGPAGTTRVDPEHDATYVVQGRIGDVTFEARGGVVRCIASDCPDQICVHAGAARSGNPIVCAPNGVIAASSRARESGELDAVSR